MWNMHSETRELLWASKNKTEFWCPLSNTGQAGASKHSCRDDRLYRVPDLMSGNGVTQMPCNSSMCHTSNSLFKQDNLFCSVVGIGVFLVQHIFKHVTMWIDKNVPVVKSGIIHQHTCGSQACGVTFLGRHLPFQVCTAIHNWKRRYREGKGLCERHVCSHW